MGGKKDGVKRETYGRDERRVRVRDFWEGRQQGGKSESKTYGREERRVNVRLTGGKKEGG